MQNIRYPHIKKFVILCSLALIIVLVTNIYYSSSQKVVVLSGTLNLGKIDKYIINLDKRHERLQYSYDILTRLNYNNLLRYKAIDGSLIPTSELKKLVVSNELGPIIRNKRTQHKQLSKGAVGCYVSHTNLWRLLLVNKDQVPMLIFEDDIAPLNTLTQTTLNDYLYELPSDWDLLLLGGEYTGIPITKHLSKIKRFFCLHAYLIRNRNNKTVELLLNKAFKITQQIDSWLSDLSEQRIINVYGLTDLNLFPQDRRHGTDIQTTLI